MNLKIKLFSNYHIKLNARLFFLEFFSKDMFYLIFPIYFILFKSIIF
jgi:hypothetical protein